MLIAILIGKIILIISSKNLLSLIAIIAKLIAYFISYVVN